MKGYEKYGRQVGLPFETEEDKQALVDKLDEDPECVNHYSLTYRRYCAGTSCTDCVTQALEADYEK